MNTAQGRAGRAITRSPTGGSSRRTRGALHPEEPRECPPAARLPTPRAPSPVLLTKCPPALLPGPTPPGSRTPSPPTFGSLHPLSASFPCSPSPSGSLFSPIPGSAPVPAPPTRKARLGALLSFALLVPPWPATSTSCRWRTQATTAATLPLAALAHLRRYRLPLPRVTPSPQTQGPHPLLPEQL